MYTDDIISVWEDCGMAWWSPGFRDTVKAVGEALSWATLYTYYAHNYAGHEIEPKKPLLSLSLSALCVYLYERDDSLENLSFRPMKPKPLLPSFSSNRVCFPTKRKYLEKAKKKKKKFPFRSLSFFFMMESFIFSFLLKKKKMKETLIPSYKFVCS